jgi:hypothetical protein
MEEQARFDRRYSAFVEAGLCPDGAQQLAQQMLERDRDGFDDRRVCFECENYKGKVCTKMRDSRGKYMMPLRFILQRCEFFSLKGKK